MAEQLLMQQREFFAPVLPTPPTPLGPPKTFIHGECLCGQVRWTYEGDIPSATSCNCTACRRYGALWAYSYVGDRISTTGPTSTYSRGDQSLDFHFCRSCGCLAFWRAKEEREGRVRIAVNLRMADPKFVSDVHVKMFDGLVTMQQLPGQSPPVGRGGKERCVRDFGV